MVEQTNSLETHPGLKITRSQFVLLITVGLLGLSVPSSSNLDIPPQPDNSPPDIKFFLEAHPESIKGLYGVATRIEAIKKILTPETCEKLQGNKMGISLATIDLDRENAEVIRNIQRNYPDISFALWVATPNEKYFADWGNLDETEKKTEEALKWKEDYDLSSVTSIGFDAETAFDFAKKFYERELPVNIAVWAKRVLPIIAKKLSGNQEMDNALKSLSRLFTDIRSQGLKVEGYVLPFPLNLILGTVTLPLDPNDNEFAMIFPSTLSNNPHVLDFFVKTNLRPGRHPGIGIISGLGKDPGRQFGPDYPVLKEEGLTRSLRRIQQVAGRHDYNPFNKARFYAITGPEVIDWTQNALEAAAKKS